MTQKNKCKEALASECKSEDSHACTDGRLLQNTSPEMQYHAELQSKMRSMRENCRHCSKGNHTWLERPACMLSMDWRLGVDFLHALHAQKKSHLLCWALSLMIYSMDNMAMWNHCFSWGGSVSFCSSNRGGSLLFTSGFSEEVPTAIFPTAASAWSLSL